MNEDTLFSPAQEIGEKAGYNQAGEISRILSMLRLTITSAMLETPNDFNRAVESCRAIINVISGKVKPEEVKKLKELAYEIEDELVEANEIYTSKKNGQKYFRNAQKRIQAKRKIETLWETLERTQDEYGYGMFAEDDSGL